MNKISIICVVRNDGYGELQIDRTNAFLKSLQEIPNKEKYELVLVEWNPPQDSKSFFQQYEEMLPKNLDIKIVQVPNTAHIKVPNKNNLPLFEYIGKNVGGIRASGEYLIFTNPDNIFFPETWLQIANYANESELLRLCRLDVKITNTRIIYENDFSSFLEQVQKNKIQFFHPPGYGIQNVDEFSTIKDPFIWEINHEGASGDFLGISKKNFELINGYREYEDYGSCDGYIIRDLKKNQIKQRILTRYSIHIDHGRPHLHRVPNAGFSENNPNHKNFGLKNFEEIKITNYKL
jgi:hypothetical protein